MSTTVSDYDKRRRTRPVVSGVIAAGVATALVAVAAKAVRSLTRSRGPTVERARKKTGSSLSGRSNVRHSFKVVTYDGGVPTERSVTIQTLKRSSKSSKAERELPFLKLPISCTVHLVDEARDVEKLLIPILEKLEKDPHLHLFMGLDTEWTQGSKVALLQIEDGENCFLFRVLKIRQSLEAVGSTSNLPSSLCSLLQHQRVMFSGSAIRGDVGMMKAQFGVQIAHSIDLQDVCKRHAAIRGFVKAGGDGAGLRGLTRRFLKHDLSKDRRIRCGDWGVDEYSAGQLHYAAVDAVVGRLILLEMVRFAKDAAVESATKNSAHDDLISVSPVKVQRRPLAASHLPLPPREMWKWCTDLVMHGTDFEKLERREAKKKKVQAKLRAQKQKQKQKTNSWRPLLHPVLRLHDKKMRLAFATPGYSKKLLAKAKLQNVVDQLNLHVKSTRSSEGSAEPRALVRASAHDGSKVPTNCFLAAWHPLAPPADVTSLKKSKAKSSSQKQDDADVSKEGLDIAVNWLPAYDWRAGRPQCVFTAVDDLEGGESRECVPWVFSVKPKGKKKRQQHVEIPLPEGFCRILENAYSAGIGSVDLPRAVLSALLDTNKTDDEDNVSSNEQMATMRVLLFSILEQQSAHDEGTTEQAQPPCRLSLSPHGVVQLNKTTSLFRKTDRATRTALRLAPSHWYVGANGMLCRLLSNVSCDQ